MPSIAGFCICVWSIPAIEVFFFGFSSDGVIAGIGGCWLDCMFEWSMPVMSVWFIPVMFCMTWSPIPMPISIPIPPIMPLMSAMVSKGLGLRRGTAPA